MKSNEEGQSNNKAKDSIDKIKSLVSRDRAAALGLAVMLTVSTALVGCGSDNYYEEEDDDDSYFYYGGGGHYYYSSGASYKSGSWSKSSGITSGKSGYSASKGGSIGG